LLLEYRLPRINANMTEASIERRYAEPGDALGIGTRLLDLRVDLSSSFSQDCPPISFYRIVMRERAYLREVRPGDGAACPVGDVIAIFSTEPDEPLGGVAARAIRVATAGISQPVNASGIHA
jgi:hypothetical protein